jgi:hypothetical protein
MRKSKMGYKGGGGTKMGTKMGYRGGGMMGTKMSPKAPPIGMKPGGATNDKLDMVAKGDKMVPAFAVDGKGPNDLGKVKKSPGGMLPTGPIRQMKKMYKMGGQTKMGTKGGAKGGGR